MTISFKNLRGFKMRESAVTRFGEIEHIKDLSDGRWKRAEIELKNGMRVFLKEEHIQEMGLTKLKEFVRKQYSPSYLNVLFLHAVMVTNGDVRYMISDLATPDCFSFTWLTKVNLYCIHKDYRLKQKSILAGQLFVNIVDCSQVDILVEGISK